jgi:uncharacterized coiled-coil DUF342 family protein
MEAQKDSFEGLYKKHHELLRSTEAKLEKETNDKQRLEWTSKTLSMELKNIKERQQSLEEERNLLNQRCQKLKEERDQYGEYIFSKYVRMTCFSFIYCDNDLIFFFLGLRRKAKYISE